MDGWRIGQKHSCSPLTGKKNLVVIGRGNVIYCKIGDDLGHSQTVHPVRPSLLCTQLLGNRKRHQWSSQEEKKT